MAYKNPHYHRDYFRAKGEERRAYLRARYKKDPSRQVAAKLKWRAAHPAEYEAQKAADAARERAKRARQKALDPVSHKLRQRAGNLKTKFGIALEDYERMFAAQQGRCGVCGGPPGNKQIGVFNVDHDHVTGAVRGLLCHLCNNGLGCFRDNPTMLFAAANYLLKHQLVKEIA